MKNQEPIIIEQTYNASQKAVWYAITNPSEMKQWYFENISDFNAEVGYTTRFLVNTGERIFPHCWKITRVKPGQAISYHWTFDGYQGKSVSHWELTGNSQKTTLRLTSEILEPFPDTVPEFKRESGVVGWRYFIKERLVEYLEKK